METVEKRKLINDNIKRMMDLTKQCEESGAEFNNLVGEVVPYVKEIISATAYKFRSIEWLGKDELGLIGLEVFWLSYRQYKPGTGAGFITYFTKSLSNKYLTMNWNQDGRPYRVSNDDKEYMRKCKIETARFKRLKSKIEASEKGVGRRITKDKMVSLSDFKNLDRMFPGKDNIVKEEGVKDIIRYMLDRVSKKDKAILKELYRGCRRDSHPCHRAHVYLENNNSYGGHMATYAMRDFVSRMRLMVEDSGMDTGFLFRS